MHKFDFTLKTIEQEPAKASADSPTQLNLELDKSDQFLTLRVLKCLALFKGNKMYSLKLF